MTPVCDLCESTVEPGSGYIFYSIALIGPPGQLTETGAMLLCKDCAQEFVNEATWSGTRKEQSLVDISTSSHAETLDAIKRGNVQGIVKWCKTHGLSPNEAKEKAHALAVRWWDNPEEGAREAIAFWRPRNRQR